MLFDPENRIVQRCAEGMMLEGQGDQRAAAEIFGLAWDEAATGLEKFIAAHYVARHQSNAWEKLKWDRIALEYAQTVPDVSVKGAYPSLYLNIAKGYEDTEDFARAHENYEIALSYAAFLDEDGYRKMIQAGIAAGIERVSNRYEARPE